MKYCSSCGKSGVEGLRFCPQCGQRLQGFDSGATQGAATRPAGPRKNRRGMRVAAGILTILGGLIGGGLLVMILHELGFYGLLIYLPGMVAFGGGVCALKRVRYGWALAGAILSVLFPLFGIPAVILLVKSRGDFSAPETDKGPLIGSNSSADLKGSRVESKMEPAGKTCPHCGQSLHHTAMRCGRCKEWVPNELFERLCSEDTALIRDSNLIPYTPSLMVTMVIGLLRDSKLNGQVQTVLGTPLDRKHRFNLIVFESYCYFTAIGMSAKTKRGCQDRVIRALKDELLTRIAESFGERILGIEEGESTRLLKAGAESLYKQFDHVLDHLGTDNASQMRNAVALASAVYGDQQANMVTGLPLYAHLMETSFHMQKPFRQAFLVEEEDFDWQAVISGPTS